MQCSPDVLSVAAETGAMVMALLLLGIFTPLLGTFCNADFGGGTVMTDALSMSESLLTSLTSMGSVLLTRLI